MNRELANKLGAALLNRIEKRFHGIDELNDNVRDALVEETIRCLSDDITVTLDETESDSYGMLNSVCVKAHASFDVSVDLVFRSKEKYEQYVKDHQ